MERHHGFRRQGFDRKFQIASAPDLKAFSGADVLSLGLNYGARLRGTLTPSQTGDYTFTIAGDEQAELWISSTQSPFAKRKIAYSLTKTNYKQWLTGTRQSAGTLSRGTPTTLRRS